MKISFQWTSLICLLLLGVHAQAVTNITVASGGNIATAVNGATVGSGGNCVAASGWITIPNVGLCVHLPNGATYSGTFTISKSGSSGAVVRIISDTQWGATVTGAINTSSGTSYFGIVGVQFTGPSLKNTTTFSSGTDLDYEYNYVHDVNNVSCNSATDKNGVVHATTAPSLRVTVNANVMRHFGSPSCAGGSGFHGFYLDSAGLRFTNNIISGGTGGWGLQKQYAGITDCTPGVISGNTIFNNQGGMVLNDEGNSCRINNWTITNNIIVNNGIAGTGGGGSAYGIDFFHMQNAPQALVSNNMLYGNLPANTFCNGGSGCPTLQNPKTDASTAITFINFQTDTNQAPAGSYSAVNYKLKSGSAAIGGGTASCASGGITPCIPSADFSITALSSPPPVGAFTFTSGGGGGSGTLTLSTNTVGFGSQATGTTSSVQLVTLTNNGTIRVTLSAPNSSLTGTNATEFNFGGVGTCGSSQALDAGQSCTISLVFQPVTAGAKVATLSIFSDGTGSPQTVSLTGTGGAPIATLSTASLAFGSQQLGTTSAIQNVTLTNTGNSTLTISSIALTGTDSSQFTLGYNCGSTLAVGAFCTLSSTFKPTTAGAKTASISIVDNASGSPQSVALTGTGTGTPDVQLSPTSLSYGAQAVGSSSATQTVTLTNNGTAPLTINSIQATGDFFLSATGSSFITGIDDFPDSGGGPCSDACWKWTHDAGTPGTSLGTSTLVATPSLDGQARQYAFTWTSAGGERWSAYTGAAHLDTTSTKFQYDTWFYTTDLTGVGQIEMDINHTLADGTTVILGTQCNIVAGVWDYTTNVSGTAHWNHSNIPCTASTFTPNTWHHVVISSQHDAAGVATYNSINFDGTLTAFVGATGADDFALGFTPPGNVQVQFQMNGTGASGGATAYLDRFQVVATGPGGFCASPVAAGANCQFNVTFAPSAPGARTGNLIANTNAAGSPTSIPLTGTGTQGAISLAPGSLTFTGRNVGTTSAGQVITITNTGSATVTIASVALGGTSPGDFGLVNGCGGTLTAGNSCTATITFSPTATGSRTATLQVTDDAPNSPQAASLTGTGTAPIVSLAPSSIPFGNQITGSISSAQNLTLTNTGTGLLTIASIALTGADTTQFTQSGTCGATLAVGAACTIAVRFAPTTTGAKSASVTVTDDATGSPHSSTLSGTGIAGAPVVSLTPSTLNFPSTLLGVASASQSVTLTNTGTAALTITLIATTGDFSQTNGCVSPIAVNASCLISVRFTPTVVGARTGTLSVTDNASGSPHTVSLTGTGQTSGGGGSGIAVINPSSLTFTSQVTGTTSAAQVVTLRNTDTVTMAVNSITFGGGSPTDYAQTNNCVPSLGAGASCTVSVTFTPIATGARPATMVFTDSASDSPQSITVTGTGIAPFAIVNVTPTSLDFGSIQQSSTTANQTITVKNVGTAVLNITSITKTGTNAADYGLTNGCGATLAINATCLLTINFTPSSTGTRTASISIASSDPVSPTLVPLTGVGTAAPAPKVTLSASSLTFALTAVGTTTATQTVTVTNTGDATLNISSITLGAPNATDYILSSGCGATLAAAANCILTLSFKPVAAGTRLSNVRLVDDASDSPQSFNLTGTAFIGTPTADLSVSSLIFLSQVVLTTSSAQAIAVTNNGTAALVFNSITATSDLAPGSSEYSQTNNCGTSLPAGASCVVNTTFKPQAIGARTGKVTFVDNAAGPSQVVTLMGTGVNPPPPPGNSATGIGGAGGAGGRVGTGVH